MIAFDNKITYDEYAGLRKLVGWSPVSERQFEIGMPRSLFLTVLRDDGRCIGLARALGDGGYYILLSDVIVHPDYQKQGWGRKMLEQFMKYVDSINEENEKTMLILTAAKGKEGFYEKFGFVKRPDEKLGCGMSQWYTKAKE